MWHVGLCVLCCPPPALKMIWSLTIQFFGWKWWTSHRNFTISIPAPWLHIMWPWICKANLEIPPQSIHPNRERGREKKRDRYKERVPQPFPWSLVDNLCPNVGQAWYTAHHFYPPVAEQRGGGKKKERSKIKRTIMCMLLRVEYAWGACVVQLSTEDVQTCTDTDRWSTRT